MTDKKRAFNEYCERYTSLCFAIGLIRSTLSSAETLKRLKEEEPEVCKFLFPTELHEKAFVELASLD